MIRALFDTKLWISPLLGHGKSSTIDQVVAVASSDNVELIVPQELIEELRIAIAKSSYLAVRITQAEIDALCTYRTISHNCSYTAYCATSRPIHSRSER